MLASWGALRAPIFPLYHPGSAPFSTAIEGTLPASWAAIRATIVFLSHPWGAKLLLPLGAPCCLLGSHRLLISSTGLPGLHCF
jgi:hypothetical protein